MYLHFRPMSDTWLTGGTGGKMRKKYKLDPEEQEILDSFEKEELISILTHERKSEMIETARNTLKKTL